MKTKIKSVNQTKNIEQLINSLSPNAILSDIEMKYVYGGDGDGGEVIIIIPPPPEEGT